MSDNKQRVIEFAAKNKRMMLLLVLLLLGVGMILFSSPASEREDEQRETLDEYKMRLEEELEELCSSVRGVGACRVTVTFERGEERVYKGSSLLESRPPKVMGVTVVCKGADSDKVKQEIIAMMTALFDIGSNRIAVLKLN